MTLTLRDVGVLRPSGGDETEPHASEVVDLFEYRIRIDPDLSVISHIRARVGGSVRPAGVEAVTASHESAREVGTLEFER